MKATIVILLSLATVALSQFQQCQPDFSNYLQCVATDMTPNYRELEKEYIQNLANKGKECFATSLGSGKCILLPNKLVADMSSRDGPLAKCKMCRIVAKLVKNAFLQTSNENLTCIRDTIRESVQKQLAPCLKSKFGDDFVVPDLPDFDAGMFDVRKQMITATSMFINMASRVSFCRNNNPAAAVETTNCLADPKHDKLPLVCSITGGCTNSQVGEPCKDVFAAAKPKTCECVTETTVEIKRRVANIHFLLNDILDNKESLRPLPGCGRNSSPAGCHCALGIKKELKTAEVDWFEIGKDILSKCISGGQKPKVTLDKLLEIGCNKAFSRSGSSDDLQVAFTFFNNVIDAITHRVGRFCRDSC